MKTIDIAELENVTGGAGRGTWIRKGLEWGGRLLNWGGAALQVSDWFGGSRQQPTTTPAQPTPPASGH